MLKIAPYDLHIHTNLSVCSSDPLQTVENITKYAADNGIYTICITNHVWDCEVPAGNDFYVRQPFSHIMKIRDQIPEDTHGVRVLIGAEIEYAQHRPMLRKEYCDQLDFVLIPHSHIHMRGVVLPDSCTNFAMKAQYLKDSFISLINHDVADAVAHPFSPLGHDAYGSRAILSCLTDDDYAECFTLAKQHNTAIELNGTAFWKDWDFPETMYEHERVFSIARDCGCTFTMGSDAHSMDRLPEISKAVAMANKLGITENRFMAI